MQETFSMPIVRGVSGSFSLNSLYISLQFSKLDSFILLLRSGSFIRSHIIRLGSSLRAATRKSTHS